jgi:hypothetical protein
LARRGRERLLGTFLLLILCQTVFAETAPSPSVEAARDAFLRGDNNAALSILRDFRSAHPDSPRIDESLALSVQACLASGDDYLARFFALKLVTGSPASASTFLSCFRVAEKAYAARSYGAALVFYADAVASFDGGAPAAGKIVNLALLRAAELTFYQERDPRAAAAYFHRVDPRNVAAEDLPLVRALRVRLAWSILSPQKLGLTDGNVSSLRVDNDDLWVGTWNGGVARYSVSAGRSDAFPLPSYPRSIEVAGRRVWVGSTDGLDWYGKATGAWRAESAFQSPAPLSVQSLKLVGDTLYAGTLGNGLLQLQSAAADAPPQWASVSDGNLPGRFVTCIAQSRSGASLYLGTLSFGLIIMDRQTGSMMSLSEIFPDFSASNVTSVLEDAERRVWIGTYGDGLYLWSRGDAEQAAGGGTIRHFSKAGGQIGDDWILAICETARAMYFGSFGGGASVLAKNGTWRRIGIADGLGSLDITAIAWRAPYVFFGTLGAGVCVYDEEADGS